MVSKKMNSFMLKELRKTLNMDQVDFASNAGISTRTLVSIERGESISETTRNKVLNYLFSRSHELEEYGDEFDIELILKPIESSHKYYGEVESNYAHDEYMWIRDGIMNGYGHYGSVKDLYEIIEDKNDSDGYRDVEMSDYSFIQRDAVCISTDDDSIRNLHKAISKEKGIWLSTDISNTDDNKALNALRAFEEVLSGFEDISTSSSSLKQRIKSIESKTHLIDAYTRLIDNGYHIILGRQTLLNEVIPIFFIEDRSVRELTYSVETIHPRFMNDQSNIPYWTYTTNGRLENVPSMITAAKEDPDQSIIDSKWYKLCNYIIGGYSYAERKQFNDYCLKYIRSNYSKKELDAFQSISKKITSIPF